MQDITPDQFIKQVNNGKNDYFGLSAFEYCNINFDNQAKRDMAKQLQECYSWGGGDYNKVIDTLEYIAPDCEYCAKHSKNNNSANYDLLSDMLGDDTDCLLYTDDYI
jgi:hypothetical protein